MEWNVLKTRYLRDAPEGDGSCRPAVKKCSFICQNIKMAFILYNHVSEKYKPISPQYAFTNRTVGNIAKQP